MGYCLYHSTICYYEIQISEKNNLSYQFSGDICKLPPAAGPCFAYFRRYHYDHKDDRCKLFVFGGCNENGNNFRTQHDCEVTCMMRGRGEMLGN